MRVAFTGASGTGKTTLAKWVSETFGVPLNPVGSRSVAREMGFENPYDVDATGRRIEFQRNLQTAKTIWENDETAFVTDRTTLDELVYTLLHASEGVTEDYLSRAISHMGRYTHVFFCSVDVFQDLADDPHRVTAPVYHRLFELALRGCFEETDRKEAFLKRGWEGKNYGLEEFRMPDLAYRKSVVANVTRGWR